MVAAYKAGLDDKQVQDAYPRLDAIPFESEHQYMATLHGGEVPKVYLKGSVESILTRCDASLGLVAKRQSLDADTIHAQVEAMASRGQRVLAFASLDVPTTTTDIDHPDVAQGLTFLGLQAMIDPPREEAMQAVRILSCSGYPGQDDHR